MTSKLSRSALIAALAVGASGLVAVPAASAADTQYFVNSPVVTGVSNLTPQSVVLHGAVDTGGNTGIESVLAPGTTLSWTGGVNIINSSSSSSENIWIDGIPTSGSNTTAYIGTKAFSNAGADNYSNVEFEIDPVSDYTANGDTPGSATIFGTSMEVPTATGLTAVSSLLGAYGTAAQNNSSQTPLTPDTKYYHWIVDQPGTTDAASDVNVGTAASPSYSCVPNGYASTYLSGDSVQGPCIYQYGNNSGIDFYQSPNGEFTTPKLGELAVGAKAMVSGSKAMLMVANRSGFRAAGMIELKVGGKVVGKGKFNVLPHGKRDVAVTLNAMGAKAAGSSAMAKLVVMSNFGQKVNIKSVQL